MPPSLSLSFLLFLSLLSLFACVSGFCAGECSGKGVCVNDTCACDEFWGGEDCSLKDRPLKKNKVAQDVVGYWEWVYFHTTISKSATLKWDALQESALENCDIYLQRDAYPRFRSYIARNTTKGRLSTITLPNASPSTYFLGVFGVTNCRFNLTLSLSSECENDCSEVGECHSGICVCPDTSAGTNCEIPVRPIQFGDTVTGNVSEHQWMYYTVFSEYEEKIEFSLKEQETDKSDCDLYISSERPPTLSDWEYSKVTTSKHTKIVVSQSMRGKYYIGIYAFDKCFYTLSVTNSSTGLCGGNCSHHGVCETKGCVCDAGYEGTNCLVKTDSMDLGVSESGFVGEGRWNFFHIRVLTQNTVVVTVIEVTQGDVDVYVRADRPPSLFEFDFMDRSKHVDVHLPIREPGDHIWYIGLFGKKSTEYSLLVDESVYCECGDENPHGHCDDRTSVCICDDGWTGIDCTNHLLTVTSGSAVIEKTKKQKWSYFQLDVNGTSTVVVSVSETKSIGMLWIFVSVTGMPTLNSYDQMNRIRGHTHEVSLRFASPHVGSVYVGVYGSPYASRSGEDIPFWCVVWNSPF